MYKDLTFGWSSLSLNLICAARKMNQCFHLLSVYFMQTVCACVCVCVCVSYLILKET